MSLLAVISIALSTLGQIEIPDRTPIVVPGPVCAAEDGWSLGSRDVFSSTDGADFLSIGPEGYFRASCGTIVLPTDVLFDFNRAVVKPGAIPILRAVANHLADVKDVYYVDGHADSVGTESYNYDLGLRRAKAVMNTLIDMGISSERLIPRSFGKARPIASNNTDAGRSRNRRVELIRLNFDILPPSERSPEIDGPSDEANAVLEEGSFEE